MANEISEELYNSAVFEDGGSLVVDLTNIEEMKFELIAKGIYDAQVDACDYEISKNSGSGMFKFVFAIDGGDMSGRKLFYYTSFAPKALSGTKTALLRIDPNIFTGPFKPQEVAQSGQLLGKRLRIKVGHEDYQGEPRAKVVAVLPPTSESSSGGDSFFG